MTDPRVKEFWDNRAAADVDDVEVTHRDVWQRWLEIETIKQFLRSGDRLLDVGCGSGYTTRLIAPCVREAVGVDNSAGMIERARRASAGEPSAPQFEVDDALSLDPERHGTFDVVLSSRCLINLPGRAEQQAAIRRVASMLKPGGRFLFLEGSSDGRTRLNSARLDAGLDEMPTVWHNVDFAEAELLPFLAPMFDVIDRRHFGVYDFVARVVHPLTVAPAAPSYEARINEVAAKLALQHQHFPELSRVIFLVLQRKAAA